MIRVRLGASTLAAVALALACCAPSGSAPSSRAQSATADTGVTLAENSGPTLVVLSLDPAEPGANTVQIDVHDATGAPIPGSVRVDGSLDGAQIVSATLPTAAHRAALAIAHSGRAEFRATVLDGKGAGATVSFALDVQAGRAQESTLGDIDRAMLSLRTMRETQTLTSGGPPLVFHFEYLAPDRVRYTTLSPTGQLTETRLIGRDRFDREAGGPWTHTDLGFPTRVPFSAYAHDATRVRVIGHDRDGGQDILELAFVQAPGTYYRLWVGAQDHLVRHYVMMAQGHYMTGAYSDYDAVLAIAAP